MTEKIFSGLTSVQNLLTSHTYLNDGPLRLKQHTNTLKIRILSQTSILYLIRNASFILTVVLEL